MNILNAKHSRPKDGIFIGRPSILGNPYVMHNESERSEVIAQFKTYLIQEICKDNSEIIYALRHLRRDSKLVCFCAPLRCHGHIIEEVWIELAAIGLKTFQEKYSPIYLT